MYGGKQEINQPVAGVASLDPAIYDEFTPLAAEYKPPVEKERGDGLTVECIHFTFKKDTLAHTHIEYIVAESDPKAEEKATNSTKRIYELIKAATNVNPDSFDKTFSDFAEFAKYIVSVYKPVHKVKFKVVGSVYNNKRKAGFPQYGGFIDRAGSSKIRFSNKEMLSNAQYYNFKPEVEVHSESSSEMNLED